MVWLSLGEPSDLRLGLEGKAWARNTVKFDLLRADFQLLAYEEKLQCNLPIFRI